MLCPKKLLMMDLHKIFPSWDLLVKDAHFIPLYLLYVVIHPLLVTLSRLTTNGDIMCLHLPSRAQLVAHILVDNPFTLIKLYMRHVRILRRECVHGTNLPPHLASILIWGSFFSSQYYEGLGVSRMTRIHGWKMLYFSTLEVSIVIECYKWPIDWTDD